LETLNSNTEVTHDFGLLVTSLAHVDRHHQSSRLAGAVDIRNCGKDKTTF
jgi:hypothetical protein